LNHDGRSASDPERLLINQTERSTKGLIIEGIAIEYILTLLEKNLISASE
jgi:hypothetical protein